MRQKREAVRAGGKLHSRLRSVVVVPQTSRLKLLYYFTRAVFRANGTLAYVVHFVLSLCCI